MIWNMRVCISNENKPVSGSFSNSDNQVNNEKAIKTPVFCSYGKKAIKPVRLPKYGRFTPHIMAANVV